jgi:AcrR family transcriptional regulator
MAGMLEIQRARIVAATVEVVSRRGIGSASVSQVVARSGVSRRTFYEIFDDHEDCLLAAFDDAVERIATVVVPAYRQSVAWRGRVRAALAALLEMLHRERSLGRFVIVETLGAGPRVLERRGRVLARVAVALDEGRGEIRRGGDGPPPLTAEGLIGGALSLIHARLVQGDEGPLVDLLNPLMSMIVLPYLGAAAARREHAQPSPKTAPDGGGERALDPFANLHMRLTYRTVRVLQAIAELDGRGAPPSNRQIADHAEIRDQGQVSKLLTRLAHLGLIHNASPHAKGEPNAWTLTERGSGVSATLTAPTPRVRDAHPPG